ncbi:MULTISPECIES: tetratricopeptide repeat protein [unclassified Microbacterium]|uniref:tetratricopeptide repeat protein n=1 Tax=unclassified Microbacterium TaxID=2609290 RepID=UPI003010507B
MPAPRTLDELCLLLTRRRTASGAPSYAEIARRIGQRRGGDEPAKVTVYDCFRPGRRRVDPRLVEDIGLALGATAEEAAGWADTARTLNGERSGVHIDVSRAARGGAGESIGRERLIAELPTADVLVLSGLPGVGKSTLASALVEGQQVLTVQLRESEPERPAPDPVDVLRRLLGAWGARSVPYDLARLRERFAAEARGATVVIEDAASVWRLAPLIVDGIRYVVTSRVELTAASAHPDLRRIRVAHVAVPPLSADDALRLLRHLLGASHEHVPEEADLRRMVEVAGGLPLDLAMLAGIVRDHAGWTFDDLASRFEAEPRDARIRPVLDAATRALDAADAELLADLALLDRDIDLRLVLEAAGAGAEASVERLRSRHLIEVRDGRLHLHATVFAFARERSTSLRPASVRRSTVRRFLDALHARLARDDEEASREAGTLLAVAEAARRHGLDEDVERLAIAAHPALARWSMWTESLRLHELAAEAGGLRLVPELALGIAHCAEKLGRYDEALVTLHRVRRVAAGASLARTWNQIGNVERWMSRFEEALSSYRRAILIAREHGDPIVEGRALGNHADTLRILARYAEAQVEYDIALRMAVEAADELNQGIVRGNRALLRLSIGELDAAEADLRTLREEGGERPLPYVLRTLALVSEARGDDASARARADEALRAARAAGEFSTSAELVLLGARIDARAGRHRAARAAAEGALAEAEQAGSPLIVTEAANSLGEILGQASEQAEQEQERRGLRDEAAARARQAQEIAEVTGDVAEVGRAHRTLARLARAAGRSGEAAAHAAAARTIDERIGRRGAEPVE